MDKSRILDQDFYRLRVVFQFADDSTRTYTFESQNEMIYVLNSMVGLYSCQSG